MRHLVIGLGSMGRRRVRVLQGLGETEIVGYDLRADRLQQARTESGISIVSQLTEKEWQQADSVIISVPPDVHHAYLKQALHHLKPAFVEASVILDGLEEIDREALQRKVLIAPSCTLRFHPAISEIKGLVQGGKYGRLTNFSYHSGQFLPDWHPWEKVSEYYVGKKETGGGREIVPFELTWICDVLGPPTDCRAFFGTTTDVGAPVDDTYVVALRFPQGFGTLLVDVVCRIGTRQLVLNLEQAQIRWNWEQPWVDLYEAHAGRWIRYNLPQGKAAAGYNPNIIEEMYIEEIRSFLDAVKGTRTYPNSLADDIRILQLLQRIEQSTT